MPMLPEHTPAARTAESTETAGPGHEHSLVVEIAGLKATLLKALRLLMETVIVPTALLAVLLHTLGLREGLAAAIGWCLLTVGVRWFRGRDMPGTLLLCASMFSGRAAIALLTSSAFVYLIQPAVGSVLMALLFLGSAALGRPITLRLARDFVTLPAHVLDRSAVRRMFSQVALLWGVSRLVDAAMSVGFIHAGVDAGLLSRGVFSPVLTAITVAVCAAWGWRALRREGISLKLVPAVARSL